LSGPVVIVGGGLAGWTVARELRQRAPALAIHLVCADAGDFYSKPMLSNAFAQKKDAQGLVQRPAAQQAAAQSVVLHPHTRVRGIDRAARRLLTDGEPIPYGSLVLAIGADPIRLPTPGMEHALSVNDIADYAAFRTALAAAGEKARVVIIGGGLIGSEFANDLAGAGYPVRIIDPAPWLIGSLVAQEQGHALQAALAGLGVESHLGDLAERIEHAAGAPYRLALRSGRQIEADVLLCAVGLRPRTGLAQDAGLELSRGILVDELGRTSDPSIYALGDCAAYQSAARPDVANGAARPLPFILPIMAAAKAIAATLAGQETPIKFGPMPVRVKTPAHPLTVNA
jgi:rubredoxin-NAD+ reductase